MPHTSNASLTAETRLPAFGRISTVPAATATRALGPVAILLLFSTGAALLAEGEGPGEEQEQKEILGLIEKLRQAKGPELWRIERALEAKGKPAAKLLKTRLEGLSPDARLASAKALYSCGSPREAVRLLLALLKEPGGRPLRVEAADLIASFGIPRIEGESTGDLRVETPRKLHELLAEAADEEFEISLAKALWVTGAEQGHQARAYQTLKKHLDSAQEEVRLRAALAAGELPGFHLLSDKVRSVLEPYEGEPTDTGRRATAALQLNRLIVNSVREQKFFGRLGNPLLQEIIEKIQKFYVDEEYTNAAYLVTAAAKGIARGLDRFSSYMTQREWEEFQEGMSGKYAGIGIVVNALDGSIVVDRVFRDSPARGAGIKCHDRIVSLDGTEITSENYRSIVEKLRGDPDTKVGLKIARRGRDKPEELEVTRKVIEVPSVYTSVLPGRIGYLKLTSFGEKSHVEVDQALAQLEEKHQIGGLIFDLRGNPGGLLTGAQKIADLFLDGDKMIVYSQGRDEEIAPRQDYRTLAETRKRTFPMVVLVNGHSASAAEVVAGALQDHKRAALIGEKTYGKGSVQQLMPLEATKQTSRLKLTIAKYFLPSGRSIHEIGIEPEIRVSQPERSRTLREKARRLSYTTFHDYFVKNRKEQEALLRELAESDEGKWNRYPGFAELSQSLTDELPKDYVRNGLRETIRKLLADEDGQEFEYDIVEDRQLQRAVTELATKMGLELSPFKRYDFFAAGQE